MKFKAIRYQNFRQFGEKGEINFNTDNKVTIVYGANGDGKTTLHQLFQWILYRRVLFNRTTSDTKLYNLAKAEKLSCESNMVVWGEIEFEHEGEDYLARREYTYYKNKSGSIIHKAEYDEFLVQKKNQYNDWAMIEKPEELIEEILPSGLSSYFFFDGETMIADLKIRGTDSAKTLKKALYTIFDLEAYEKAVEDIGKQGKSEATVLGKLYAEKLKVEQKKAKEVEYKACLKDIAAFSRGIASKEDEISKDNDEIEKIDERLHEISEQIGTSKSKKDLEKARKTLKDSIGREQEKISDEMLKFGECIDDNYAFLLLSEVVKTADERLYMQVQSEERQIIPGLTKELLVSLLDLTHKKDCVCGRCIGEEEIKKLEEWKSFFPPASYKSTYDKFQTKAAKFSGKYQEDRLYSYLGNILKYKNNIGDIEKQIDSIDEQIQQYGNVDDLIQERKEKEDDKKIIKKRIETNTEDLNRYRQQLKIREKKRDSYYKADDEVEKCQAKIDFMENVLNALKLEMYNEVKEYSSKLQEEIQYLIEQMLTSKRTVHLTEEFQLQVVDSYSDESKSEGQFAVVSFAYIGGILKVLKSHDKLKNKEYPLVLDGPFSKLGEDHKENVINVIPEYAPQIIIFSKDPLGDYFDEEKIGKVWTIVSNSEKNNAQIKEGFLWN